LSDEKTIQDFLKQKDTSSRVQWIILTPTLKSKNQSSFNNTKRIDSKLNEKELFKKITKYIHKTTQEKYQELLENYKTIVDESAIVSQTDKNGIITYVNDNFSKISGYSKEELLGRSHNIIRHPDVSGFFFKDLWHTLKAQKEWKGLLKNKNRKGQTYYLKTHIKPLLDSQHNTKGYISIRNEITDVLDPKETLMDDIKNLKKPMLVLVKIEEFNELEEYYTIQIIRNIEQAFSQSMLNFFPKNSGYKKVYPLRNGEFALLKSFDDVIYDESKEVLLLKEFQNNVKVSCINYDKYDFNLNVILSYDMGNKNIFENVRLGIKQAQKNKLNIINAKNLKRESKKHIIANLKTLKMIKDAVENHRIKTYYQPISCNKCDKIVKYESLARIVKENGVVIRPINFIDAAKRMKYYTQITDTMINNIFFAMREYKKKISLNLSSYDIEDNRIREKIIDMIFEYNMAHKLTIELLEDEESKDFTKVKNFITIVKKMGVKIAIDDFGSGYSNFSRLMQFEPDILKIDGSIIRNIDTNVYNKHIVDTIINFASKQKIKTVAEFVYNKEIFDIVKDMGVDYSQGYYIGEPKPYFLD
jgi:PAS domain S-box-containing protein